MIKMNTLCFNYVFKKCNLGLYVQGIKTLFFPIVEQNSTAISQAIWKNNPKAIIGENATLQCIFSGRLVALYLLMNINIKKSLFINLYFKKKGVFHLMRNWLCL